MPIMELIRQMPRNPHSTHHHSHRKDNSDVSTYYGNTMYDRRVARGSNFASMKSSNVASTEHLQSRQAEARRRAAVRQRAQIRARKLRTGTPPPVDGRKHEQMQTEKYLEELSEKPPEKSIACQADLAEDSTSSSTIVFPNSIVNGEDAETQIYPGDVNGDYISVPQNQKETSPKTRFREIRERRGTNDVNTSVPLTYGWRLCKVSFLDVFSTEESDAAIYFTRRSIDKFGLSPSRSELPEYDDQVHTIVTFIVNKILREAILEINEEIEKFRSCNYFYDEKIVRNATSTQDLVDNNIFIITRDELTALIQTAVENLKNLKELDVSVEYLEKVKSSELLEITIKEIKTIVRDVKFLSEIIRAQARISAQHNGEPTPTTSEHESREIFERNRRDSEEVVSSSIHRGSTREEMRETSETQLGETVMAKKTDRVSAARNDNFRSEENADFGADTIAQSESDDSPKSNQKTDDSTSNNETEVTNVEDEKREQINRDSSDGTRENESMILDQNGEIPGPAESENVIADDNIEKREVEEPVSVRSSVNNDESIEIASREVQSEGNKEPLPQTDNSSSVNSGGDRLSKEGVRNGDIPLLKEDSMNEAEIERPTSRSDEPANDDAISDQTIDPSADKVVSSSQSEVEKEQQKNDSGRDEAVSISTSNGEVKGDATSEDKSDSSAQNIPENKTTFSSQDEEDLKHNATAEDITHSSSKSISGDKTTLSNRNDEEEREGVGKDEAVSISASNDEINNDANSENRNEVEGGSQKEEVGENEALPSLSSNHQIDENATLEDINKTDPLNQNAVEGEIVSTHQVEGKGLRGEEKGETFSISPSTDDSTNDDATVEVNNKINSNSTDEVVPSVREVATEQQDREINESEILPKASSNDQANNNAAIEEETDSSSLDITDKIISSSQNQEEKKQEVGVREDGDASMSPPSNDQTNRNVTLEDEIDSSNVIEAEGERRKREAGKTEEIPANVVEDASGSDFKLTSNEDETDDSKNKQISSDKNIENEDTTKSDERQTSEEDNISSFSNQEINASSGLPDKKTEPESKDISNGDQVSPSIEEKMEKEIPGEEVGEASISSSKIGNTLSNDGETKESLMPTEDGIPSKGPSSMNKGEKSAKIEDDLNNNEVSSNENLVQEEDFQEGKISSEKPKFRKSFSSKTTSDSERLRESSEKINKTRSLENDYVFKSVDASTVFESESSLQRGIENENEEIQAARDSGNEAEENTLSEKIRSSNDTETESNNKNLENESRDNTFTTKLNESSSEPVVTEDGIEEDASVVEPDKTTVEKESPIDPVNPIRVGAREESQFENSSETTKSITTEKSSHIKTTEMKESAVSIQSEKSEEIVSDDAKIAKNFREVRSSKSKETNSMRGVKKNASEDTEKGTSDPEISIKANPSNSKPGTNEGVPGDPETSKSTPISGSDDTNNANAGSKQQSTNTDPIDDEEDADDSDDMDIEGTRIIEETFTETTKTYKEISIRETTLVEREFFEYTTTDDELLENSGKSGNGSRMSSRESTASDNTKQEVVINIERRASDRADSLPDGKQRSSQNHNGTVLMKEV